MVDFSSGGSWWPTSTGNGTIWPAAVYKRCLVIASEGVPRFCNLAMRRSVLYCISEAAMNMLNGFRLATVVLTALLLAPGLLQAQRQAPMTSVQPSGRTLGARPANTVRVRPAQAPRVAVVRTQIGRASCRERV